MMVQVSFLLTHGEELSRELKIVMVLSQDAINWLQDDRFRVALVTLERAKCLLQGDHMKRLTTTDKGLSYYQSCHWKHIKKPLKLPTWSNLLLC